MAKPQNFGGFTLYRIWYGEELVYVGRTKQPLQDRIRGHLFKKPMHREIDITLVSRIEYATFQTEADMYLYEIYFINLWHPPLNRDDNASDTLTVALPPVEWHLFETPLWESWRDTIQNRDREEKAARERMVEQDRQVREMRRKMHQGEITEDEYWEFLASIDRGIF